METPRKSGTYGQLTLLVHILLNNQNNQNPNCLLNKTIRLTILLHIIHSSFLKSRKERKLVGDLTKYIFTLLCTWESFAIFILSRKIPVVKNRLKVSIKESFKCGIYFFKYLHASFGDQDLYQPLRKKSILEFFLC